IVDPDTLNIRIGRFENAVQGDTIDQYTPLISNAQTGAVIQGPGNPLSIDNERTRRRAVSLEIVAIDRGNSVDLLRLIFYFLQLAERFVGQNRFDKNIGPGQVYVQQIYVHGTAVDLVQDTRSYGGSRHVVDQGLRRRRQWSRLLLLP